MTNPATHAHHQQQATCAHQNAKLSFFTETGYTYTVNKGEVVSEQEWEEPELTDSVTVWCPECHLDTTYADWRAAPASIGVLCKKIRMAYWDEEDDGFFSILIHKGGA